MVAFASSSCCSFHVLPFPAASKAFSPRSRRARSGLATGCCSGPTAAPRNASLVAGVAAVDRRRCECFDLHQQIVHFAESWPMQQSTITRRKGLVDRDEDHSDTLIALHHPPVCTLGTDSTEDYLHFDVKDAPFEVHRIDRGGEVTYHIMADRSLEEVIIRAVQSAFSIKESRIEGLTGVWVGDQKVAAIGIHVSQWIAYHGLALNGTTDLAPFQLIVPCGIKDCDLGSIKGILQKASNEREIDETVLMDIAYKSLIKELAEIFQLSLDLRPDWNLRENNNFN